MKKIMFNDRYGLTQAVLEGRKTQTRRIAYTAGRWRDIMVRQDLEGVNKGKACLFGDGILLAKSAYKLGETIAIAQKYEDLRRTMNFIVFVVKTECLWSASNTRKDAPTRCSSVLTLCHITSASLTFASNVCKISVTRTV